MTKEDNPFSEIDKVDQRFKGFIKAIDKCETTKELKIVNDIIVYENSIHDLDSMTYSILVLALNVKRCELGEPALFAVPLNEYGEPINEYGEPLNKYDD